jgi:chromate transport protein ChrA
MAKGTGRVSVRLAGPGGTSALIGRKSVQNASYWVSSTEISKIQSISQFLEGKNAQNNMFLVDFVVWFGTLWMYVIT